MATKQRTKWLSFEMSFGIGHIITLITLLISIVWGFAEMDKRLTILELQHKDHTHKLNDRCSQLEQLILREHEENDENFDEMTKRFESFKQEVERIHYELFKKN